MNTLLLSLILAFGAGQPADRQDEARTLFREGTVKYDSADYDGAIESFTEALALVADDRARLTLLFNIAKAHEKAFEIDGDVTHLRQALTLYRRYLEFAQSTGDLGEVHEVEKNLAEVHEKAFEIDGDVTHLRQALTLYRRHLELAQSTGDLGEELGVEKNIARLEGQIRSHNQLKGNQTRAEGLETPPPLPPVDESTDWRKTRNTGVGLVVGSGAATIGGVVLLALGSTFEGNAKDQVNELADKGVPLDHPAWEEGDEFIARERRRGAILMGVGGSIAVVGAVGVGAGSYYLVKSKRLRERSVSATPALTSNFAGIQVSGRF